MIMKKDMTLMKKDGGSPTHTETPEKTLAPWLQGRSFDDWYAEYDEVGYVIFDNVLTAAEVARVRAALTPHLTKEGRNDFEGFKTNRVYALVAKAPGVFAEMITHPLPLAFAERELGASFLLSGCLAINLHPGETVQDWHFDDSHIHIPLPRAPYGVSTFWAIDAMTETNGATEVIPGSHRWTEAERMPLSPPEEMFDTRPRDPHVDPAARDDSVKALMSAGSLMVAKGTLWHRGGANTSARARLIVTPQYCPGWARQLENMLLAVPGDVAARLPKRARELLGYSIHGGFMGFADGEHPDKQLQAR